MAENPEDPAAPQYKPCPLMAWIVVLLLLFGTTITCWFVGRTGYFLSPRRPDVGSLGGFALFLLVPALLYQIVASGFNIASGIIRESRFVWILLLLPLTLFCLYDAVQVYPMAKFRSNLSREKFELTQVAASVDTYKVDNGSYPSVLEDLPRERSMSGYASNYDQHVPFRYKVLDDGGEYHYVIWSAGPDARFDLDAKNEIKNTSEVWQDPDFLNNLYDPTNGFSLVSPFKKWIPSPGDIVWFGPYKEASRVGLDPPLTDEIKSAEKSGLD